MHPSARIVLRSGSDTGRGLLELPSGVLAQLGLHDQQRIRLQVREKGMQIRVAHHPGLGGQEVRLPRQALRHLLIPDGQPLHLARRGPDVLELGPFVGILAPPPSARLIYGPQTAFFRRLITLGHSLHMCVYIFSPHDVRIGQGMIRGRTALSGGRWRSRPFPLPHAVYDRSRVNRFIFLMHRLLTRRLGIPIFNRFVGSKWWQHRLLRQYEDLTRYLPDTHRLNGAGDIARMLRRHGSVYVKAAHGGKGMGIFRVQKSPGGGFDYQYTDRICRVHGGRAPDLNALLGLIRRRPRGPYIVQQRLRLMRYRGRIFDIRILVQKDREGQWQVTGSAARIGRRGGIVSNLHGGGSVGPVDQVLGTLISGESVTTAMEMRLECERVALRVAHLIDEACGCVGELGIDLAVDGNQRIWFLEANSRTGRKVFTKMRDIDRIHLAHQRPLEFAQHLAGF